MSWLFCIVLLGVNGNWGLFVRALIVCSMAAYVVFSPLTSTLLLTVLSVFYMWHISRNAKVLICGLLSTILVFSKLNLCSCYMQCSIRAVLLLSSSTLKPPFR